MFVFSRILPTCSQRFPNVAPAGCEIRPRLEAAARARGGAEPAAVFLRSPWPLRMMVLMGFQWKFDEIWDVNFNGISMGFSWKFTNWCV